MANALDVAKYILKKQGQMTAMKLQKLVYYAQAWSLVWDDKPLYDDEIQAWTNGPVIPKLYNIHKGEYLLKDIPVGDISQLQDEEKETIDVILTAYGDKKSQWLSDRTHSEAPWINARNISCAGEDERCTQVITLDSMAEYYSAL